MSVGLSLTQNQPCFGILEKSTSLEHSNSIDEKTSNVARTSLASKSESSQTISLKSLCEKFEDVSDWEVASHFGVGIQNVAAFGKALVFSKENADTLAKDEELFNRASHFVLESTRDLSKREKNVTKLAEAISQTFNQTIDLYREAQKTAKTISFQTDESLNFSHKELKSKSEELLLTPSTLSRAAVCILKGIESPLLVKIDKCLGQGGTGLVQSGLVHQQESVALKTSLHPSLSKSLQREYDVLSELHSKGEVTGIQLKPHTLHVLGQGKEARIAYLAPLYEGSIKADTMSAELFNKACLQLTSGLRYLQEQGWHHGDIKLDNIFIKGSRVDLSDFGEATNKQAIQQAIKGMQDGSLTSEQALKIIWPGMTDAYVLSEDLEKIQNLLTESKQGNVTEKQIETLLQASDIYALGLSLSKMSENDEVKKSSNFEKVSALIGKDGCQSTDVTTRLQAFGKLCELLNTPQ